MDLLDLDELAKVKEISDKNLDQNSEIIAFAPTEKSGRSKKGKVSRKSVKSYTKKPYTEAEKIRARTALLKIERIDLENVTEEVLIRKIEEMRIANEVGLTKALNEEGLLNLPKDTYDSKNYLALKFLPGMPEAEDIDILEPSENIVEAESDILP